MEVKLLQKEDALAFKSLTFGKFQGFLFQCNQESIVVVGVWDEGVPCGLAIAAAERENISLPDWTLISFFVKGEHRRRGAGTLLWEKISCHIKSKGCKRLSFQGVFREEKGALLSRFFEKQANCNTNKIAEIYRFDSQNVVKSPFVKGARAGVFNPPSRFELVSWMELNQVFRNELSENKEEWYPPFVSPLIGQDSMNEKCTIFALDQQEKKIAGWITVLDVNQKKNLLYRSFFTREDYRTTQIGFFLFTEAVKRHLDNYIDREGLSSIPLDNENALRFSRLFFRDAYKSISYEYNLKISLMDKDESFVKAWEGCKENKFPCFAMVDLNDYDCLSAFLYDTGAGHLPVLYIKDRKQFEEIICKIFYKGEKRELPKSMGAMMVKGWKDVLGQAHKVILLSDGYYSNILPEDIGLSSEEWREKSYYLRLAHEATHYYALRMYGFMSTGLMDEFIADSMGIITAFGKYERAYFLKFMGLENYPNYRLGGRLENYLPKGFKANNSSWLLSEEFEKMKSDAYKLSVILEEKLRKSCVDLSDREIRKELLDELCRENLLLIQKQKSNDIK